MQNIINLGIVAHVDAGKTTLTEQLLYLGGAIRSVGSVDKGTSQTDYMDIERRRGISVRAAATVLHWKGVDINIIDTPGHVDFAPEAERALRILDCAILVLSAVEGVQARTEVLWEALEKLRIPTILFVNKTDREGADLDAVLSQIHTYLTKQTACIGKDREQLIETVAAGDDALLEQYFSGVPISDEALDSSIALQCGQRNLFPLLYGSALKGEGIAPLFDSIVKYFPKSKGDPESAPSGVIFKVEHDKTMGRLAYVRLYNGRLHNRDSIYNQTQDCEEKITQIRKCYGKRQEDTGVLEAGDIAAVCGLSSCKVGDVLGTGDSVPPACDITMPMLQVQLHPETEADYSALVTAVLELEAEDPMLDVTWVKEERELLVHITGVIQLEVLGETLRSRFGLEVHFDAPSVIYKETPLTAAIGFDAYTMPKPCWAVLKFLIEPGPLGSGVQYQSKVPNKKIFYRYQSHVAQTIPRALKQGPLGWEVTDVKITLIDGEHHTIHTHPLDFFVATPMAIMNGLVNCGTGLLEPMLSFRIAAPESCSGKIMGEIINMRGTFESPVIQHDTFHITGRYPVATSMEFPTRLAAITSGKGVLSTRFDGYQPCPLELGATAPYRGINPLDRSKYILYARKAIQDKGLLGK